jgi:AcrR family transcriptional regulator
MSLLLNEFNEDRSQVVKPQRRNGPLYGRGECTRQRIFEPAKQIFANCAYHDASVLKVTDVAEVAQGTFDIYYAEGKTIFDELVEASIRQDPYLMTVASMQGADGAESERLVSPAFFHFTTEYRAIHQTEFVSPRVTHSHYDRSVVGLREVMVNGEIARADSMVKGWGPMTNEEMIGAQSTKPNSLKKSVFRTRTWRS